MTRLIKLANNAVSRLTANITSSGTSISLTPSDGAKFPALSAGQYFMGTLVKADGTTEVVKVTARATDTLTIVRAQEAVAGVTTAYAFSAGDRFEARLTAGGLGGELDRIEAVADAAQLDADAGIAAAAAAQSTADGATTTANAALPKAGGTMTGALTMDANVNMGTGKVVIFEGATADAYETTLTAVDPTADRTVSLPNASGTLALSDVVQSYTAAQRGAVVALTDAASIATNLALGNNFSVTLGGNRTLANPTNLVAGQSGVIVITQDATGSRTLAYGAYWKFANGTAPTLTTASGAVDVLAYYVESSTRITARLIGDVK